MSLVNPVFGPSHWRCITGVKNWGKRTYLIILVMLVVARDCTTADLTTKLLWRVLDTAVMPFTVTSDPVFRRNCLSAKLRHSGWWEIWCKKAALRCSDCVVWACDYVRQLKYSYKVQTHDMALGCAFAVYRRKCYSKMYKDIHGSWRFSAPFSIRSTDFHMSCSSNQEDTDDSCWIVSLVKPKYFRFPCYITVLYSRIDTAVSLRPVVLLVCFMGFL